MFKFLAPTTLTRFSARRAWLVLALWVVTAALAFVACGQLKLAEGADIPGSESAKGEKLLEERLREDQPPGETVVVQSNDVTIDDYRYQEFVANLVADLERLDGTVAEVVSYYDTNAATMISSDRTKTIIDVTLTGSAEDAAITVEPLLLLVEESQADGFQVLTVGDGSLNKETQEVFHRDLLRGEMIGIPVALIILLIVLGAAVAAGLPLLLAILGIVVAMGVTAVISQFMGMTDIVQNMVVMIGLAVGIDYTLFIVERFREESRRGLGKHDAIAVAGNTASRAVLFSGLTVVIALCGLLIVPASSFRGMAIGAIAVAASSVVIAVTLLPALLSLLGDRINALRLPFGRKPKVGNADDSENGFWARSTALVMRHPVISMAASSALLIAMAVPFVTIELGQASIASYPDNLQSIQGYKVLDAEFSAGVLDPAQIVISADDVRSDDVQQGIAALREDLAGDERFEWVPRVQLSDRFDLALVEVVVDGDGNGKPAQEAVKDLRATYIPEAFAGMEGDVYVAGGTAGTVDYIDTMTKYLPIVIGFVLALSFLLLMAVFRSIVIPIKAIVMNLLSVGAAYGLLVLVFQHGVGAGILGFQQTESIAAFLPVFLFAILFGLSMDYHVFLLSRIQERYLKTGDNTEAVAHGLRSTARIITGAAAIMVAVFTGFALGDLGEMQQFGFGLAAAVFIDATIIRSVLVPSSMQLLGKWNWYFPTWLEWIPAIHVEGSAGDQASEPRSSDGRTPEPVAAGAK